MTKWSNRHWWQTWLAAAMWLKGVSIWAFGSLEMTHYRSSLTRLVNAQPWVVHNLWRHYKVISASIALPLWHVRPLAVRTQHLQHGSESSLPSRDATRHLNVFTNKVAVKWLILTFLMRRKSLSAASKGLAQQPLTLLLSCSSKIQIQWNL